VDAGIAFGRVLRRLREASGLTQEQLGFEADLRRTYIGILELGQQQCSGQVISDTSISSFAAISLS
jgi:transcriptional regulator with XRE-family HTH domain